MLFIHLNNGIKINQEEQKSLVTRNELIVATTKIGENFWRGNMPTFFYDQFKSTRGKIRHILHADLAVGLPIK